MLNQFQNNEVSDWITANLSLSREITTPFDAILKKIMREKKMTKNQLSDIANISIRSIERYLMVRHDDFDDFMPSMKNIVAISVVCNLDILMVESLLDSLYVKFNKRKKRDRIYCWIIENHSGKSIPECNKIMRDLGLEYKHLLTEIR